MRDRHVESAPGEEQAQAFGRVGMVFDHQDSRFLATALYRLHGSSLE
jgi:hypothetical protein